MSTVQSHADKQNWTLEVRDFYQIGEPDAGYIIGITRKAHLGIKKTLGFGGSLL